MVSSTTTTTTPEANANPSSSYVPECEGFVVGDWILEARIGSGSYGVVWSARHEQNHKQRAAVKVINTTRLKTESERRALYREAAVHKRMSHNNITTVYEVIETETRMYIVMELVEGGSLFDHMVSLPNSADRIGGLPESQCASLFYQMLSALEHCHSNLVLHRDIKLENFLIDKKASEVKLTDFGLCTTFVPNGLQRTGCGSPLYIAPEVLMGLSYDGTKADIWGLGVTLYSILLNRMPFLDAKGRLVVSKALAGLKTLPGWLSTSASEVLRMVLEPNPNQRATISNLLRHPWVIKGKNTYEKRLNSRKDSETKLRRYSSLYERIPFFTPSAAAQSSASQSRDLKSSPSDSSSPVPPQPTKKRRNSFASSTFLQSVEHLFGLRRK